MESDHLHHIVTIDIRVTKGGKLMANYNPQMGYPTTGQAPIATQYPYGVNNYSNILTKQPY